VSSYCPTDRHYRGAIVDDGLDVSLFTDGACSGNPGPGGWAAILKHPASGKVREFSGGDPDTTNNRMEMLAVIRGLEGLSRSKRWKVRVVTDSQYVVRGMTEWIKGWIANNWRRGKKASSSPVKNADLWRKLLELCEDFDVTFVHVRGHSGHPENEECDRLAVAAIEKVRNGVG